MDETTEYADQLSTFLQYYERYVQQVLKPTQTEISEALAPWRDPLHWTKYKRSSGIPIPSPVRRVSSRIKRPEQVVDKIFRKPDNFPAGLCEESVRRMSDTVGVRLLVFFLSHLPLIDRELQASELFDVSKEDPPLAYMSPQRARVLASRTWWSRRRRAAIARCTTP